MNKKADAYFSRARTLDGLICSQNELLDTWRSRALKITSSVRSAPVSSSESSRPMADAVDAYQDFETSVLSDISAYIRELSEIRSTIAAVPDPECRLILEKRYLLGLSTSQIAEVRCCSVSSVQRLLRRALDLAVLPSSST